MHQISILNADGKEVASLALNNETGFLAMALLMENPEGHGWHPTGVCQRLSGTLEFRRPEEALNTQRFCFGTRFPELITVAIPVEDGYQLTYEVVEES